MRVYRSPGLSVIWFLILTNFLVFLFSSVRPEILYFLGLTPAYFLHQPWTIVTSMFLHAGWGHIIFNMISLYFLGSFLVRLIGENKFLLVYLVGGVAGNILFIILAPPYSIGIGASGAIYALGGVLMIMAPWVKVFIFPIPIPIPLWVAIIIFLLLSFLPGIAWEAHLGGLLFGLGAGYYFKQRRGRGNYVYRM
ncbi:MAG: rhomboid family intramembrane serine protease [Dehalococcoidia bacterium]|nr:rhomboid family intramembrane serine protease [Dehalococcoidia bacterium]